MRKLLFIFFSILLLNGCAQSTALIGPAITVGTSGNIVQAGYSYGSNMMIKEATGKTPSGHVTSFVIEKKKEKKRKKELTKFLESHIVTMRNKIYLKNHIENMRSKLSIKNNN
tara:strand:- start:414 stop:752 length:339 start_codon:yes stop_codon:yes gene_type:complete